MDHGIRPFAPVLLRVLTGHEDLQLLTNGEEVEENILKTVQYTTKPATSLGLESMLCRESGCRAARYGSDSYRPGHAERMMGLLQSPGPYVHAQTSFTGAICAPIFGSVAERGLFQTISSCQVRRVKCCFIDCLRRQFYTVHSVRLRQRVRGSVVTRAIRFRPPTRDLSWEHINWVMRHAVTSDRYATRKNLKCQTVACADGFWCIRGICLSFAKLM